jgi:uncharacterized membrane protein (DUF106 family)
VLDEEAMRSYKKRLTEIDEELNQAVKTKDVSAQSRCNEEKEAILGQLVPEQV